MKVQYVAFDGEIFDNEMSCKKYESDIGCEVKMFDSFGKPTESVGSAYVLYIPFIETGKNEIFGAKWFIDQCEANDEGYEGIEPDSSGIFYWNEYESRYNWIDSDTAKIIANHIIEFKD